MRFHATVRNRQYHLKPQSGAGIQPRSFNPRFAPTNKRAPSSKGAPPSRNAAEFFSRGA
jgi:hypothetical protein